MKPVPGSARLFHLWTWALWALLGIVPLGAEEPVIGLWTFGAMDPAVVQVVRTDLEGRFVGRVVLKPGLSLPVRAFYEPRHRYRAERLLRELEDLHAPGGEVRVALTGVDISTTKGPHADWGIFGLASLGGPGCVVSTFRLRGSREVRRERLRRVVRHEVLHTFGLEHCPVAGCLMEDARGTIASVDRGDGAPCPACRIRAAGRWR